MKAMLLENEADLVSATVPSSEDPELEDIGHV